MSAPDRLRVATDAHAADRAVQAADAAARAALSGWVARQCDAVVKDGVLSVTGKGATPFLGIGVGTKGPGQVILRARCAAGGEAKIEWVPPGKTAAEAASVPYKLAAGDWQEVSVPLPADANLGILRVYLPAQQQPVEVKWIELKTADKAKRWDFK